MNLVRLFFCLIGVSAAGQVQAQSPLPDHLVGGLGGAIYGTSNATSRHGVSPSVLPYAYFDYERFFVRVDTLGVKTLPIGAGYLELVGRISLEGVHGSPSGNQNGRRSNPLPLGIGTFQETSVGGFFLYTFYDPRSGGALLEATYAAEIPLRGLTLYPQAGIEHRTMRYVRHLYGVSAADAAASGSGAYKPDGATTPVLSLAADIPLAGAWALNLQVRRAWSNRTIRDSPLYVRGRQDSGFIAISYNFK